MLPKESSAKKSSSGMPLIETDYSQPKALIVNGNPLISENLSYHFQTVGVTVQLLDFVDSPADSAYPRSPLSQPSQLSSVSADYFIYIHGESVIASDLLQALCSRAVDQGKKALLVFPDYYPQLSSVQNYLSQFGHHLDYRLVLVRQPYGYPFTPDPYNPLLFLLSQYPSGTLSTSSLQASAASPVHIDDVCSALLKILFSSDRLPIYLIGSADTQSLSDFAYELKKILETETGSQLQLDLHTIADKTPSPNQELIVATQAHLDWHPDITLKQGIVRLLPQIKISTPASASASVIRSSPRSQLASSSAVPKLKSLHPLPSKLSLKVRHARSFSRFILYLSGVFLLLVFLISPLLWTGLHTYLAAGYLKQSVAALEQGSPDSAKDLSLKAKSGFQTARTSLALSRRQLFFLPSSYYDKYDLLFDSAVRISSVLALSADSVKDGQTLYQAILAKGDLDIPSATVNLKSNIQTLYNDLSLIQASLTKVEFSSRFPFVNQLTDVKSKLPDLRSRLELSLAALDVLPRIIGLDQPRSYLVLLQNNAELRPTGGFIGSVALVTFNQGHLLELQVEDVYNLDGQLGGHVEPPAPLKEYLESHWYLRDSNWHPDFPTAAKQISWFYEKESGRSVDGVIGINIFTLQSLLSATGPVDVPELGEQITADNLFDRAEYRSEVNFFPGSTQKKDFLAGLTQNLLSRFKEGSVSLAPLAKSLDQTISQTNIIFAFTDSDLQELVEQHNWSGSLKNLDCPQQFKDAPCTGSTFALIEANIGINKSNYFLKRRLNHRVLVGKDGDLTHTVKVFYNNTSPSHSWPGGRYKTYTRFYAPLNSELLDSKFKGETLEPKAVAVLSEAGLQEFSFVYEIDPLSEADLELVLKSPQVLSTGSPVSSLSLNWQKQSGTSADNLTVTVDYPAYLTPAQISLPAASNPQQLIFTAPFARDLSFAAKFRHQ